MSLTTGTRVTDRYEEATGTVVAVGQAIVRQSAAANGLYGQTSGSRTVTEYTVQWDCGGDPLRGLPGPGPESRQGLTHLP